MELDHEQPDFSEAAEGALDDAPQVAPQENGDELATFFLDDRSAVRRRLSDFFQYTLPDALDNYEFWVQDLMTDLEAFLMRHKLPNGPDYDTKVVLSLALSVLLALGIPAGALVALILHIKNIG